MKNDYHWKLEGKLDIERNEQWNEWRRKKHTNEM